MNIKNHIILIICGILAGWWMVFAPVQAQSSRCDCFVKGVVRDEHTGQPIPGAILQLIGFNKGESTDSLGRYQFSNLCPGKYEMECLIVGYHSQRETIDLTEDHGHEENFTLAEEEIHLRDVEITTRRTDAPITQPLSTLSGAGLARTRGHSLGESLKGLAGLTTLQTGASIAKPVIHGMHSNRILIMNNGVRQEGQQWGSEHAPEIDPFVATRLSVVKGAAGVRYGSDAIGGVILVEPNELPIDKPLSGELNSVYFSNGRQGVGSVLLEGGVKGLEGLGWRAQGTLKRGGNMRTPHYYLDNTGVAEQNFSLAAGYRHKGFGAELFYSHFQTKVGIFSGAHIGSVTDLLAVIESGEPLIKADFTYAIGRPYQDVNHNLLKGEAHYHFPDGNRLQWVSAWQLNNRMEYDLHRSRNDSLAVLDRPELSFRLTTFTNDIVWNHKPLAGKLAGEMGLSTLYQYNLMSGRPLIPNFDQWNIGLFAIERLVSNGWELEAGLRYDYRYMTTYRVVNRQKVTDLFRFHNASGTLGAGRNLNDRWSVRLNMGSAWRPPNVSELFSNGVHHGAASFEEGNSSLRSEKAYNTIASIQYRNARLELELGGYLNFIRDYIYLQPQPQPILTVRGAFPYFKYTQTDATFQGIDATVNWKFIKGIEWTSKASYLRVRDVRNDSYLVMIPPNRWENQLSYSRLGRDEKRSLRVAVGNRWVAQQERVSTGSDFIPPPGAYSLWNVQAGSTFVQTDKSQLELTLTIDNLLDTAYRDYLNRFRYFSDEVGRTVSLRARWVFGK